jgi:putative transposase
MKAAPEIRLTREQRATLKKLISSGTNRARVHTRARILLMAAERSVGSRGGERRRANSNIAIAELLGVSDRTVARVRQRLIQGGLDSALYERPRIGRPPLVTGDIEAKLVMLACSCPPEGRNRWTLQLLADKMVELGYVEHISDVCVMKRLKKTGLGLGLSAVGAYHPTPR